MTKDEIDRVRKYWENSPAWVAEQVPLLLQHIDGLEETLERERAERKGVIDAALCQRINVLETELVNISRAFGAFARACGHPIEFYTSADGNSALKDHDHE